MDLIFQRQLADEQGITLGEDELASAIAADGTFPEMRRISALVIQPTGAATGQATADDRAEARQRAEAALAELRSGTPLVDLVDEYSPATAANDGDLGYGSLEDIGGIDPVWADALFALDEGGITDIVESAAGDLLIGVVTSIAPEAADTGFLTAVNEDVGEATHRRNVELEATADRLEEKVTEDALAADYEQVRLAEILVAGDALGAPEDEEGTIRASHILYTPDESGAEASPSPSAGRARTSPAARQPGRQRRPSPAPQAAPARPPAPLPARPPASPAASAAPARPPAPRPPQPGRQCRARPERPARQPARAPARPPVPLPARPPATTSLTIQPGRPRA